jgi:hypothetical protein
MVEVSAGKRRRSRLKYWRRKPVDPIQVIRPPRVRTVTAQADECVSHRAPCSSTQGSEVVPRSRPEPDQAKCFVLILDEAFLFN